MADTEPSASGSSARRLAPETFHLSVEKIRSGYYSDAYLNMTRRLLVAEGRRPQVLMQVFQRQHASLGGIDETIAVLRLCAGEERDGIWRSGWEGLTVHALHEGEQIAPSETVLTIAGDYSLFAHLETIYLGCLSRRTLVMRNVRAVVEAAAGKDILFFPARHDHWMVQTGDGWAAHIAGAIGVSTDAQASWWGGRGVGTIPHALIAAYGGDTVGAARDFARRYGDEVNVTVLVDFENRSVSTALRVAEALGDRLWGVRLDTAAEMVDEDLRERLGERARPGVTPELARAVREALDAHSHGHVRIVASGGFDAERIAEFEAADAPIDAYGVGSALLRGKNDFTADVVMVDGRPAAKAGRELRPNRRLERVL